MSITSTAQNISVVAAGTTALARVAAAMTAGQWVNFGAGGTLGSVNWTATTGLINMSNPVSASNSGIRESYASKFARDPNSKTMYYYGSDHAENGIFFKYNETANDLSIDHFPPWGNIGGQATARHGYDSNMWDSINNKFIAREFQSLRIWQWDGPGTQTWTLINQQGGLDYPAGAIGMCFNPDLGGLMGYEDLNPLNGALAWRNSTNGVWTNIVPGSSSLLNPTGDPHNFMNYNPISNRVFFGGGDNPLGGADIIRCHVIGPPWTSAQIVNFDAPSALVAGGQMGPGGHPTLVIANPNNGNFTCIRAVNNWYDFNPLTQIFTAKALPATMLASNTLYPDSAYGIIHCSIPEYQVIAFFKGWARGVASEMWLHKP